MKKLLSILPVFLLAAMLVGCSKDDEVEGWYKTLESGKTFLLQEPNPYPDSIQIWKMNIPCYPVPKAELPEWLFEAAFSNTRYTQTEIFQAEESQTGRTIYLHYNLNDQYYKHFYDELGNEIDYQLWKNLDHKTFFLTTTRNWKCIFILVPHKISD